MSDPSKAVFLSYASQDAEAVARIAEAFPPSLRRYGETRRAAGVDVWFDKDELVGGDAWDAKIRGQIASCALFVPVISAATQAWREGPCASVPPNPTVFIQDGASLVQSNQTHSASHHRELLRRSGGRGSESMEAHDATATPRRDGTLAADEPSEL